MKWVNEWAKFRATDSNGEVFEHENRPEKNEFFWKSDDKTASVYKVSYDRNWKNSLEERDMANEEWDDGLPGVGVVCEARGVMYDRWEKCTIACFYKESVWFEVGSVMVTDALENVEFRPIKKREPKPGEVWLVDGKPTVFQGSDYGPVMFPFVRLDGKDAYGTDSGFIEEYAAPSVKSYYAREFLKLQEEQDRCYVRDIVKEAARLDEE